MSEHIVYVTDNNFEQEVLQSPLPVLVDFWAEWCGPCRMLSPILEELAPEYADKIKIAKLNIDESANTPTKYGVRGIPTLIIFKNGEAVATHVGALTKSQMTDFIDGGI